jgi:hypothetical protein
MNVLMDSSSISRNWTADIRSSFSSSSSACMRCTWTDHHQLADAVHERATATSSSRQSSPMSKLFATNLSTPGRGAAWAWSSSSARTPPAAGRARTARSRRSGAAAPGTAGTPAPRAPGSTAPRRCRRRCRCCAAGSWCSSS